MSAFWIAVALVAGISIGFAVLLYVLRRATEDTIGRWGGWK